MHARGAREEQQYAPRRIDGGAIAPNAGLDRRGPLMSPRSRSMAAVAAAASAATVALVKRREDEAMANYFDFHKNEIEKSKESSF